MKPRRQRRSGKKRVRRSWPILLSLLGSALLLVTFPGGGPRGAWATEGGTITGSVYFRGTPPPVKKMPIDKDNDVCGTGFRELVEVNVGPNNTLCDIVISLHGDETGPRFEIPEGGFKLNQKDCRFVPDIMIIPSGEKLKITNRDQIIHNIHTYEIIKGRRRDMFNFPQPERGHRRTKTIKPRRSNTVELTCDIHSFMHGWIYVSDGSDAMVSADGHFAIKQVPDGVYTISVWHPTLGEQEVEVTMEGAQEVRVDFEYNATD